METVKEPYELLVRLRHGAPPAAHVQYRFVTTDGGVVVGETLGPAEPVTPDTTAGTPFADFLDAALVAALGQVAALTAERDALAAQVQAGGAVAEPPAGGLDAYAAAVQRQLDAGARERQYDGILSACTYAASSVPRFAAEGQACVAWRDAVWTACYAILAEVEAGARPAPTADELLAGLPPLVWPA